MSGISAALFGCKPFHEVRVAVILSGRGSKAKALSQSPARKRCHAGLLHVILVEFKVVRQTIKACGFIPFKSRHSPGVIHRQKREITGRCLHTCNTWHGFRIVVGLIGLNVVLCSRQHPPFETCFWRRVFLPWWVVAVEYRSCRQEQAAYTKYIFCVSSEAKHQVEGTGSA